MDTVDIKMPKRLADYLIGVCIAELDFLGNEGADTGADITDVDDQVAAWYLLQTELENALSGGEA